LCNLAQLVTLNVSYYRFLNTGPDSDKVTRSHLEETLDVLEDEDAAVGKVWLLRHLGAAAGHGRLVEHAILADPLAVLARQVVAQRGSNFGAASGLEGVEDQDARPGKNASVDFSLRKCVTFDIVFLNYKPPPGVNVMSIIFCNICLFSATKLAFFLRHQCYDQIFASFRFV
jgi:hypothetical protein